MKSEDIQKIKVLIVYADNSDFEIICDDCEIKNPHELCVKIMKAIKINGGMVSFGTLEEKVLVNFNQVKRMHFDLWD